MPEGPELHLASCFVNRVCASRVFTGRVVKSTVHKSNEIEFEAEQYTISSSSRGKEMMLFLSAGTRCSNKLKGSKLNSTSDPPPVQILFRFGMSGKFEFTKTEDVHKHAHLKFYSENEDDSQMVLSYVDVRRFGKWQEGADWSKDRGPDPMFNYLQFRSNIVNNLSKPDFDRPICETLLNQKYFNGVGNYLRAEVLYRLGIPPFVKAHSVLEGLTAEPPDFKPNKKANRCEDSDILYTCHAVMLEVVSSVGGGGYDPDRKSANYTAFNDWLQCYCKPGMSSMSDHNGRTVWFAGPAGPLAPKGKSKSRTSKKRKSETKSPDDIDKNSANETQTKVSSNSVNNASQKPIKRTRKKKIDASKECKNKKQYKKTKKILCEDSKTVPLRRSSRRLLH